MAKIKSVKTSSGARVQVGSKRYNERTGAGESVVSGSGKNLGKGDIKGIQKSNPNFTDEVSTTLAKREANAKGELLPYQENAPVDTTQPSPQTAEVNVPSEPAVSYEQAQQNLAQGGLTGATLASAQQTLGSKYQKGFQAAKSAGVSAPQTATAGMQAVQQYTPFQAETATVDQVFSEDPVINTLMGQAYELLNPDVQKTSLMQDYKKLYKSSGLDEINEELIDAETILDGTEDDIRNEIQTAGGLATESQVQAMTLSRNKGLLKRYNQLFAMRESAQKQLDTMLNLTVQDRQMAQERVTNQINTMFKFADFRQQSQNAIKETYKWLGASALVASGDAKQIANVERVMGLPAGGLQAKALEEQKEKNLDNALKQAQLANIYSQIGERGAGSSYTTIDGKPQTTAQATANGYADRLQQADQIFAGFGDKFGSVTTAIGGALPNFLQTADRQSYEQGKRNFITAVLRRESGASISPGEFEGANQQYFPQAGDSPTVLAQKAANRNTVINNFYREANVQRPVYPGMLIYSGGTTYKVGEDGDTLEPI